MNEFAGKIAFVTGSAGGIGLGIARACAQEGMRVVLSDIDEAALESAVAELQALGCETLALRLDVTDRVDWGAAVDRVRATMGRVQLLVNNAGVGVTGTPFETMGPEMWDRVIAVNLTGVYNGVHAFFDDLCPGGYIVNTASLAGLIPGPGIFPYVASKFGVVGYTEALRLDLAAWDIGVSVLCPGLVRTRLWRTSRAVRGLPDTDVPPDDLSARTALAEMLPDEVGRRVIDGIRANDLYIITSPELRSALIDRHERELKGFDSAAAFET